MVVPAATAAGSMLVVMTLNGLATIERNVCEPAVPAPPAAPRLVPQRRGLTQAAPAAPDEAASRSHVPPTSPRGLRHTRVHRYGYRPRGRLLRPPIKRACGVASDAATSTVRTEPAEESR